MNDKVSPAEQIRLFGMRSIMLEADLLKLERSGIDINHSSTLKKEEVVDPELFEQSILKSAKRMADFYVVYYCFENTVRGLVSDTLSEKYGSSWWTSKTPPELQKIVKDRQDEEKKTAFSLRSDDPLNYITLGELIPIFESNWADFADKLRSKKSVSDVLIAFNRIRNVIAHSCDLNEDEISRLELLVKDWQRIQT